MAEPTLADWLPLSRPHLSQELVDDEAFDRLLQMGRHLPGDVMAAIEVRLGPGKASADLSVRLMDPHQGLQVAPHLPSSCRFFDQLFRDWVDGAPCTREIHSLWLEFDADRAPRDSLPEPVICARLRRGLTADDVLDVFLPRLLEAGPSTITPIQRQLLRDAWYRCLKSVNPLYLFDLQARGRQAVRLEVYGESLEELLDWLSRIAHPTASRLDERAFVLQATDRFHISCDVGPDGWLDRVGIEASFRRWPHSEPGWQRLFAELVHHDLCTPSKENSVWEWPGYESDPGGFRVRALSHVKISVKPDAAPRAKVYFLLQRLKKT